MNDTHKEYKNYIDNSKITEFLVKYENLTSRSRYESAIKVFIKLLEYKAINEITYEDIHSYIREGNTSAISYILSLVRFLHEKKYLNQLLINDANFVEFIYNYKPNDKSENKRAAIHHSLRTIIEVDNDIKSNYKDTNKSGKREYEATIKIAFVQCPHLSRQNFMRP